MIVDAHQHFWDIERIHYAWLERPENQALKRTFSPPMLAPLLNEIGIDRTVLVQALDSRLDTEAMLKFADQYPWIGAVVGWVPLDEPELASRQLENYVKHPKFKGVRHLIHEEANPDWLLRDEVIAGLRLLASLGIPFDVVAVYPNHLKHVPTLAERVPNLRMVIDHLAKPPIRSGDIRDWRRQMEQAAASPQVYAKVSGLNTASDWASWSYRDWIPYVDAAVELFGPERLMFGSDWPVATLAGTYRQVWDATMAVVERYGDRAKDSIFGGTAQRFYKLEA
ncbi:MAG: hypothetical protein C7B45_13010 [Sulfobacillus acidophilus]|uniref:Amidohydrolase-related domain-containing protein n=1 Tax=Sulfobacillus acidophilus TaxID=53633 RepID=A0A2T2WF88_9FIRM|nr:MAG: hypothetical protein C7B45_13010 [Sulfobacillus acidophilus]